MEIGSAEYKNLVESISIQEFILCRLVFFAHEYESLNKEAQ